VAVKLHEKGIHCIVVSEKGSSAQIKWSFEDA
jgi:hypothetical protein